MIIMMSYEYTKSSIQLQDDFAKLQREYIWYISEYFYKTIFKSCIIIPITHKSEIVEPALYESARYLYFQGITLHQ